MIRFFADSNILLYSIGHDPSKTSRANALLFERPVISVQVLNEFLRVATRKFKLPLTDAMAALIPAKIACEIVPLTLAVHDRAIEFARNDLIGIYDANIVAAAELAGCEIVYSEDMNHGQRIGRVEIRNPFK